MKYTHELSRSAASYLRRLDMKRQRQLFALISQLCENPFDAEISTPLHGQWEGARRSRIGDLRVIYEIHKERLVVYIVRIGPRGDVYRG